jgi:hypothetical protein
MRWAKDDMLKNVTLLAGGYYDIENLNRVNAPLMPLNKCTQVTGEAVKSSLSAGREPRASRWDHLCHTWM